MGWDNQDGGAPPSPNAMAERVLDQALAGEEEQGNEEEDAQQPPEAVDAPLEGLNAHAQGGTPLEEEDEEEFQEENHGQWSPEPLPLESIAGQEIITLEEDEELLELLRAQIKAQEAAVLRTAAAHAARGGAATADDADRAYRDMVQGGGAAHPMLRNLTDAAPQGGELAMRTGRLGEVEDAATRQFQVGWWVFG